MLNRGGRTITSICEEAFVLLGTGAKWISEAQGKADSSNRKSSRISVQAQIKAVNDTTRIPHQKHKNQKLKKIKFLWFLFVLLSQLESDEF